MTRALCTRISFFLLVIAPTVSSPAERLAIEIDLTETGPAINPLLYGQFIEHLGRSIYGGIWAEMLEDRKFYFPISHDYAPYTELQDSEFPVVGASPWQILGGPGTVIMVAEDSFVGEHTPLVRAGAGIRQLDLGIRQGLDYEGYLWARPAGDEPAAVEVSLAWGTGELERASKRLTFEPGQYTKQTFRFSAAATVERGASFELHAVDGDILIGTVSLMPADNLRGLRTDTLALLKQLDATIYRWPGGNFVSGYDWRDGIGDRDRRPPRKNPAWSGVEHNDFGTDEFLALCRELGAEPMIAVNTGFGDAYSAAQWVEYTNGEASTLAGGWRTANGRPGPYTVRYWSVGNEMFGTWQLGFMQLHHYVLKHNEVARAMWEVDPDILLIGVGDLEGMNPDHDPLQIERGVTWSQAMLESSADFMNLISEHIYVGRTPWSDDPRAELSEHVALAKRAIRAKAEGHRQLQAALDSLDGRVVPIALDEWNYWHRDYLYGDLGCRYDLADALGIAAGLHEMFRQSDIIHMAHYAQTVNVIGAIKTSRIAAEMEPTGLVLQMYRAHFGNRPVPVAGVPEPYDAAAALSEDGRFLTVGIVNPFPDSLELQVSGIDASGPISRWHVTGENEFAHNAPGQPRGVDILETRDLEPASALTVPPLSATVFAIALE